MKKTLLFIFLIATSQLFSQSFSTGTQTLLSDLSAKIDINGSTNTTTLTISGPSNVWLAIGFGGTNMSSGADVFRTNGTTIVDARSTGRFLPTADDQQDWSLVTNTVSGSTRTIVATRANDTGDSNDFVFNASASSLSVIYAIGNSTSYTQHSGNNRGATALGLTLSIPEAKRLDFDMNPNPASEKIAIQLPSGSTNATVAFYDYIGRLALRKKISLSDNTIMVQDLSSGMYILKVLVGDKIGVKKFIKE